MVTKILLALIPISLVGGLWGGMKIQKGREVAAYEKKIEKDTKKIAKLEKENSERKVVYRYRQKVVREAVGACLDKPLPSAADGLRRDRRSPQ